MTVIQTQGQPVAVDGLELIGAGASFRNDLIDMIADVAIFNHFDGPDLQQIVRYMHAYSAKSGTVIFREGEPGRYMGILIDGAIDIRKQNDEGRELSIATIMPGKTFGEMSLLDGLQLSATGVAMEPIKLLLLSKDSLHLFLEKHAALGVKMLWEIARILSLRLRQTSGKLVDFMDTQEKLP